MEALLQQRQGLISSQLDIKLCSLSQLAVLTDCDTKAVPGGQDLFLVPITQISE